MSKSLTLPWLHEYFIDVAETHGGDLLSVPVHSAAKKVQIIKFLTRQIEGEDNWIWAHVSDREYIVPVRFSKEAMKVYRQHPVYGSLSISSFKTAIISMKDFRPMFARVPNPGMGMSSSGHLVLEVCTFNVLGSTGASMLGSPKGIETGSDIYLWVQGLREGNGGGNVLKLRKQAENSADGSSSSQPAHTQAMEVLTYGRRQRSSSPDGTPEPKPPCPAQRSRKSKVNPVKAHQRRWRIRTEPPPESWDGVKNVEHVHEPSSPCNPAAPEKKRDPLGTPPKRRNALDLSTSPASSKPHTPSLKPRTPSAHADSEEDNCPRTPSHWSPSVYGRSPRRALVSDDSIGENHAEGEDADAEGEDADAEGEDADAENEDADAEGEDVDELMDVDDARADEPSSDPHEDAFGEPLSSQSPSSGTAAARTPPPPTLSPEVPPPAALPSSYSLPAPTPAQRVRASFRSPSQPTPGRVLVPDSTQARAPPPPPLPASQLPPSSAPTASESLPSQSEHASQLPPSSAPTTSESLPSQPGPASQPSLSQPAASAPGMSQLGTSQLSLNQPVRTSQPAASQRVHASQPWTSPPKTSTPRRAWQGRALPPNRAFSGTLLFPAAVQGMSQGRVLVPNSDTSGTTASQSQSQSQGQQVEGQRLDVLKALDGPERQVQVGVVEESQTQPESQIIVAEQAQAWVEDAEEEAQSRAQAQDAGDGAQSHAQVQEQRDASQAQVEPQSQARVQDAEDEMQGDAQSQEAEQAAQGRMQGQQDALRAQDAGDVAQGHAQVQEAEQAAPSQDQDQQDAPQAGAHQQAQVDSQESRVAQSLSYATDSQEQVRAGSQREGDRQDASAPPHPEGSAADDVLVPAEGVALPSGEHIPPTVQDLKSKCDGVESGPVDDAPSPAATPEATAEAAGDPREATVEIADDAQEDAEDEAQAADELVGSPASSHWENTMDTDEVPGSVMDEQILGDYVPQDEVDEPEDEHEEMDSDDARVVAEIRAALVAESLDTSPTIPAAAPAIPPTEEAHSEEEADAQPLPEAALAGRPVVEVSSQTANTSTTSRILGSVKRLFTGGLVPLTTKNPNGVEALREVTDRLRDAAIVHERRGAAAEEAEDVQNVTEPAPSNVVAQEAGQATEKMYHDAEGWKAPSFMRKQSAEAILSSALRHLLVEASIEGTKSSQARDSIPELKPSTSKSTSKSSPTRGTPLLISPAKSPTRPPAGRTALAASTSASASNGARTQYTSTTTIATSAVPSVSTLPTSVATTSPSAASMKPLPVLKRRAPSDPDSAPARPKKRRHVSTEIIEIPSSPEMPPWKEKKVAKKVVPARAKSEKKGNGRAREIEQDQAEKGKRQEGAPKMSAESRPHTTVGTKAQEQLRSTTGAGALPAKHVDAQPLGKVSSLGGLSEKARGKQPMRPPRFTALAAAPPTEPSKASRITPPPPDAPTVPKSPRRPLSTQKRKLGGMKLDIRFQPHEANGLLVTWSDLDQKLLAAGRARYREKRAKEKEKEKKEK